MEFQDGNTERLDALRQGGEEGQLKVRVIQPIQHLIIYILLQQTAIISRRLNAVAKEVDNDKEARVAIEKFCESFEKEILGEFNKAYEEGDPRIMAVSGMYFQLNTAKVYNS